MFLISATTMVLSVLAIVGARRSPDDVCWSLPPVTVGITGYRNQSGHWISQVVVEGDQDLGGGGIQMWQGTGCHVDVQHRPITCESGEQAADIVLTFSVPPYGEEHLPAIKYPTAPRATGPPATRATAPPPPKRPRIPPAGYSPLQGVGYYRFVSAPTLSWSASRQACIKEGGDLADLNTPEKFNFVKSLGTGWTWIGLQERGANNVYYTPSDEVWVQPSYLVWYPGQPNYPAGSDCILLLMVDGRLGDNPCEAYQRNYLCEIPWH